METLTQMKCVACRKGAPTVTDAESAEFHLGSPESVPFWEERMGYRPRSVRLRKAL